VLIAFGSLASVSVSLLHGCIARVRATTADDVCDANGENESGKGAGDDNGHEERLFHVGGARLGLGKLVVVDFCDGLDGVLDADASKLKREGRVGRFRRRQCHVETSLARVGTAGVGFHALYLAIVRNAIIFEADGHNIPDSHILIAVHFSRVVELKCQQGIVGQNNCLLTGGLGHQCGAVARN